MQIDDSGQTQKNIFPLLLFIAIIIYQHYSQAGFSVRMSAADLCLVSTMNLKIAMFWLLNIYLKLKHVDK